MKSIKVKRTTFSKEDKQLLASAQYRKVTGEVYSERNVVIVRNGLRTVGRFTYKIENKECRFLEQRIIEAEFNPQIVAVNALSTYFKKSKEAEKILWQTK